MLETTNMSAAEFAERLAESAKIIKYTFRMEIPKEEQDLQDNLVACSLDQAYRMAKPLFLDRWKNHPFNKPRVQAGKQPTSQIREWLGGQTE